MQGTSASALSRRRVVGRPSIDGGIILDKSWKARRQVRNVRGTCFEDQHDAREYRQTITSRRRMKPRRKGERTGALR